MANCQIADKIGYWSAAGTFTGVASTLVYAVPDISSRTYDDGSGSFRTLGVNPNITTNQAYRLGRVAPTDGTGAFVFQLPYGGASTHPGTPASKWTIALPDGKKLTGTVPDLAGPFTLDDLASANGTGVAAWTWGNEVYVAPVTPGTLARGVAPFSGASSYSIIFDVPFASSAYDITLTASVDSVTSQQVIPSYTSKSTSGFTIVTTETFTGEVSWRASL